MLGSTCFGHLYAHHQVLTTIALLLVLDLILVGNQQQLQNQTAYVVTNAIVVSS